MTRSYSGYQPSLWARACQWWRITRLSVVGLILTDLAMAVAAITVTVLFVRAYLL